jgi:hypothetical protein
VSSIDHFAILPEASGVRTIYPRRKDETMVTDEPQSNVVACAA